MKHGLCSDEVEEDMGGSTFAHACLVASGLKIAIKGLASLL